MGNQPNIEPTSIKNQTELDQESTKIIAGAKNVAHFVLGAVLEASWARLRGQRIPNRREIDNKTRNKIDQKMDAFQVAVFNSFLEIFARKMEACWHQGRIKNRWQLRKADFAKKIKT